ncbi:T9SS type B sorting domain-containing protein [Pseudoflavitalea sp. G-6-1-2]|uniref:PKD domain-containing protein n=1 Tax=Pseudoflavitalea sp. G-6-1-2 TaxID=2728841 RepID=UPI00146EF572|nr:PKD domain-containing protein [Pseudoflavitalea sp. G-6-1-2]NML23629.1 T9SS type B sorting domain-containing protein [Pseudoflavitalea sp. G-6-1-2]
MAKIQLLILLLTGCYFAHGQDFTNKGKEFWLGFGNHQDMYTASKPMMDIYITSETDTRVTVDVPALGITIGTYNVKANKITEVTSFPDLLWLAEEGVSGKGIHIVAEQPVVVYSQIFLAQASGTSLCLPVSTLGSEYYSVNFTQAANTGPTNATSYSYFFVVATSDNTRLEIKPAATALNGSMVAGQTYTVNLNKGEVFNYLSRTDLTGSMVRSVNSGTGCNKVAMFCGSGKIGIGCSGAVQGSDNLFQQMYPMVTWGKKYLTVPSLTRPRNFYRVIRPDPSIQVKVDGVQIPGSSFINNFYYQFDDSNPHLIEGNGPIAVAQYFTSKNCGEPTGNGDPEMIFLNPVEQVLNHTALPTMRMGTTEFRHHYFNAVVKNNPGIINSFTIDGMNVSGSFRPHPADPAYAYVQLEIGAGAEAEPTSHVINCDSGFNAIVYGFSENESYGYSAGTNLSDLYQYITVQNDHGAVNFPAGCKSSPFSLAMTFPYEPTRIQWIFGPRLNAMGVRDSIINNPVFDSSWTLDGGLTLYRYKLKRPDKVAATGTYPIRVKVINPTLGGCSGEQELGFDFQLFDKPVANFNFTHAGCFTDDVMLVDNAIPKGRPVNNWYWGMGNGATILKQSSPAYRYPDAGTYTISHAVITDIGCTSDTIKKDITIYALPEAKFELKDALCEKAAVRMVSLSNGFGVPINNLTWDFGDGNTGAGTQVTHTYETTGPQTISLQVTTAKGCKSPVYVQRLAVNASPVVDFTLPAICVLDPASFRDASTISDNSASRFSWLWKFGDGNTATDQHPVYNYANAGDYQVALTVKSGDGCATTLTKPFTVNGVVQAADIVVDATQSFCANQELVIKDASRIESGHLLKTIVWWDYDRDPGLGFTDAEPVAGKSYAHQYSDFGTPPTNNYKIVYQAYTGTACYKSVSKIVTLKSSPLIVFGSLPAVCEDAAPLQIPARESLGIGGTGLFTGPGVSASGLFDPRLAGPGRHDITFSFRSPNGCNASTTQVMQVNPSPKADAGPDKGVLPDGFVLLQGGGTGDGLRYSWSPVATLNDPFRAQPTAAPKEDTKYTLTVTSPENCSGTDEVLVKILPKIVVPNAFTPNGDGINDTWVLQYLETYPNCTVDVFNRYGQRVFTSVGYGRPWDGRTNGNLLPAATYYWVINPRNGKDVLKGSVTIIR